MEKVVIVQPAVTFERQFPYRAAVLAALLESRGFSVVGLHDPSTRDLCAVGRFDLAVVFCPIRAVKRAASAVRKLKQIGSSPVLVAGTYPSIAPGNCLSATDADAAVVGDPEAVIPELLSNGFESGVRGLYDAGSSGQGAGREALCSLDTLPPPRCRAFSIEPYLMHVFRPGIESAPIETSRGCTFSCDYCATWRQYRGGRRVRPVEAVLEEMEWLYRDYSVRRFHIEDEQFFLDPDRVADLCRGIRKRFNCIDLEMPAGVRPDQIERETMEELVGTGLKRIALGIETSGEPARFAMARLVSDHAVEAAIELCRGLGLVVTGYFMIGLPGQDLLEMLRTLRMAVTSSLDYVHVSAYWPLPIKGESEQEPASWTTLARTWAYLAAYSWPPRLAGLHAAGDLTVSRLPAAAARLSEWISSGTRGGGSW